MRHVLGDDPWSMQIDIANSVRDNRITTVRACNGPGKSWLAGRIALWYLMAHPGSTVITTAPTWAQVEGVIWQEIRAAYSGSKIPLGGQCNQTSLELGPKWFAIGRSTSEADKFKGYHSEHLLAIVDEAAGVDEPIHQAVRDITTSANNRVFYIGNPTSLSGTFHGSFRSPIAKKFKISAFDTPNFTANGIRNVEELIEFIESGEELKIANPSLVSPVSVYEKVIELGTTHPHFQASVLGEFPEQGDTTLIPLAWIERAVDNKYGRDWRAEHKVEVKSGPVRYGVDPARFGADSTAIYKRAGGVGEWIKTFSKEDTMQTVGRVRQFLIDDPEIQVYVDSIGIGAGVIDRLNEIRDERREWTRVFGINVAMKADNEEKFKNKRAELYWNLRELFETGQIIIPDDDKLIAELSSIEYKFQTGKIYIEEKAEHKKRIGRSPDRADALMLSYAVPNIGKWIEDDFVESMPGYPQAPRQDASVTAGLWGKEF